MMLGILSLLGQKTGTPGVNPPPASGNQGTDMNVDRIFKTIFDSLNDALKVVDAGTPSGDTWTILDPARILQNAYDADNSALRVVFITTSSDVTSTSLDATQVWRDVYDDTKKALRVTYITPSKPATGKLDANQVIQWVHVPSMHALAVNTPYEGSGSYGSKLDAGQIIKHSFDHSSGKLDVVVVPVPGDAFADRYFPPRYFAIRYW